VALRWTRQPRPPPADERQLSRRGRSAGRPAQRGGAPQVELIDPFLFVDLPSGDPLVAFRAHRAMDPILSSISFQFLTRFGRSLHLIMTAVGEKHAL
jgi:hypothetical protein